MSPYEDLLVPRGTHLLHIGPHKTGSTAVQVSMNAARARLAEHGVHYSGGAARPKHAGWAIGLMGRPAGSEVPPIHHWEALVDEVASATAARVCVSNEDFGRADEAQRRRIVADLGGARPHVVAVARRLDRYLPSQWQERVKAGETRSYDAWLQDVLAPVPTESSWDRRNVWRAHDTARLVSGWADVVGEENFTLIVGDESDRMHLLRAFEGLLGLPADTLESHPDRSNRGLSWGETELVRAVNVAWNDRGWTRDQRTAYVKRGLIKSLVTSEAADPGPRTPPLPAWAAEEVRRLSQERVAAVQAMGVRVVGDPSHLLVPDDITTLEGDLEPPPVPPQVAATAVMGVLGRALAAKPRQPPAAEGENGSGALARARRAAGRVRDRLHR